MAVDVAKTLRKALAALEAQRGKISRQVAAIQEALAAGGPRRPGRRGRTGTRRKRARKTMSPAARKAASRRMKAYWAKRRVEAAKGKGEGGK